MSGFDNGVYMGDHNKVNGKEADEVEDAAYAFATKLLAPAAVLWALKIKSYKEIEELCSVPRKYARLRADRMEELYKREKHLLAKEGKTCFLRSRHEAAVYENFKKFIEKLKTSPENFRISKSQSKDLKKFLKRDEKMKRLTHP